MHKNIHRLATAILEYARNKHGLNVLFWVSIGAFGTLPRRQLIVATYCSEYGLSSSSSVIPPACFIWLEVLLCAPKPPTLLGLAVGFADNAYHAKYADSLFSACEMWKKDAVEDTGDKDDKPRRSAKRREALRA